MNQYLRLQQWIANSVATGLSTTRLREVVCVPILMVFGVLLAVSLPARAQSPSLNFSFNTPTTSLTTTDSVVQSIVNMTNHSLVAAALVGTNGSGPGQFGQSLDFTTDNGALTSDTVSGSASSPMAADFADPKMNFGTVGNFTLAFWFKNAAVFGSGDSPLLFELGGGANALSTFALDGANTIGFAENTSGNPEFWAGGNTLANPVTSGSLPANIWFFYALTYNGTNYYVYEGNETNTVTCVSTNAKSAQTLSFGSTGTMIFGNRGSDHSRNYAGWLAHFQFYNGYVGSQGFVDAVRQSGLPLTVGPTTFSPLSPVYVGTSVTLSATVTNSVAPYTLQWQVNQGSVWANLPGATSNNYVLNTTGEGGTTYSYQLVVTDSESTPVTTTNAAGSLFVSSSPLPPAIISNTTITPSSVPLGGTATLSAVVSGTAPVSYQWQYSPNSNGSGAVNVPGAISSTFVLTNVLYSNAGYYWLTATNASGGTNTALALLTVTTPVQITIGAPGGSPGAGTEGTGPYDLSQLSSVGDMNFPDQNGLNFFDNNGTKPGETFTTGGNSAGYTLGDLYYLCGGPSVNNGNHGAGVVYTLYIYSMTNAFAGTATLITTYTNSNVAAAEPNDVWAQWTGLTNVLAPNHAYAYAISASSGFMHVGNSSNSPAPYSGGELALFPTAGGTPTYGTGTPADSSTVFLLDLVPAGYPDAETIFMFPTNDSTVYAGTPITFSVPAVGSNIGYEWQLDGVTQPNSDFASYVLNTANVAPGTHSMQVLVTNNLDTATSIAVSFNVNVGTLPAPTISPANSATNPVYAGTTVMLNDTPQGINLSYYWQTDGGSGGSLTNIPGANATSYAFSTAGLSPGTYEYDLMISNSSGTLSSTEVTLNLAAASGPILSSGATVNPSVVIVGNSATFNASFTGSQPISYQWYFTTNGGGTSLIAGATGTSYTLSSAQLANAGTYYLQASNNPPGVGASTLNSAPVSIYVVPVPQTNTTLATVLDAGANAFTGAYDVSQLTYDSGLLENTYDPVNAYVDANTPVGQIFMTGSTPPPGYGGGYPLNYVYFKEDPNGGTSGLASQMGYILNVYQMLDATNSELLTSYVTTNTTALTAGDWIYFSGLTNILQPNTSYCLSLHKNTTATYYWKFDGVVESSPDSLFPSSQTLVAVPSLGGAVTESSPDPTYGYYYDTAFVAGLTPPAAPTNYTGTVISPSSVYVGQGPVTMTAVYTGRQPIDYQWQFVDTNNVTHLISGATNSTYTIPVASYGNTGTYSLLASNSVSGGVYSLSTPATLTVLSPPNNFIMNFSFTASYGGAGVLPSGTFWNPFNVGAGTETLNGVTAIGEKNTSMVLDDGSTPMPIQLLAYTYPGSFNHPENNPLLDDYLLMQGQAAGTYFPITFSNCIPGVYNLVLYGCDSTYGEGRVVFTFGGINETNINSGIDTTFIQNDNYAAFYNLAVTNGTLAGSWSQTGSGEGAFNGAQLQLAYSFANPSMFIAVQPTNTTVPLNHPASVSVIAEGPGANGLPGPLFYQWWTTDGVNNTPVNGATNNTYTINTSVSLTNNYYVVITNLTGLSTNSAVATVSVFVPDTLVWQGSSGPAWDLTTPNWFDLSQSSSGVDYADPDYVVFNDTASSFTVSNMVAVNPSTVVVTNTANNYVFNGTASIAGAASLIKAGAGSLTISNNQTYTGGTIVNNGTVILAKGGANGSLNGAVTINSGAKVSLAVVDALGYSGTYVSTANVIGGTLDDATTGNEGYATAFNLMGGAMTSSGGGAFNFDGSLAALNSLATNVPSAINAAVSLRGQGLTITTAQGSVPSGIDLSITGPVTDNGGNEITKAGNGVLSLSGTNTFNGDMTISGGTLRIDGAGVLNSGDFTAQIYNNGTLLSYNSSAAQTIANTISGSGALTVNGSGSLMLNGANTYTGPTTVSSGTLGGSGSIASPVTVSALGTLAPGSGGVGTLTISNNLVLQGGSTSVFEVNGSTPANVSVALGGSVVYGGGLQIVPSGTFTGGQTFTLFSGAGAANTTQFSSLTGSPGGGLTFQFTNGVLSVVGSSSPFAGTIRFVGSPVISGTSLTISATDAGSGTIYLLTSTNLAAPVNTWTPIWTNVLSGSGTFTTNLSSAVKAGSPRQFYLFSNTP